MKAVVTGAAGFIGSRIVKRLLSQGCEVLGIDSFTDYYSPALKRSNLPPVDTPGWRLVEGNLTELPLSEVLRDTVHLYHQAGQPGVRKSWGSDFSHYIRDNVQATQMLLEAIASVPTLQRLVYASSSSVYGDANRYPTRETDLPAPVSPYGVTKLAAEHLCNLYGINFGVPTTSLRYFTVYGPGQRPDMAFTRFIRAALGQQQIAVYGDGTQIRDFTYVDDVVDANILAAQTVVPPGSVFNVSSGSDVSVNETLAIIARIVDANLDIRYMEKVAGDVWRTGGRTDAIRVALGWAPSTSVETGLTAQVEWVRETLIRDGGPASGR